MKLPDISRETSLVSAVSCLESQSTSAFSPRSSGDPVLKHARERVEIFKDWLHDSRFSGGSKSNGVTLWHLQLPNEPLIAKGHILLPTVDSMAFVVECLTNRDRLRAWNTDIIENRIINRVCYNEYSSPFVSEQIVHEYNAFKGRMGFPGRDCVWHAYTVWENLDTVFIVHFSDHSTTYESVASGRHLRINVLLSGYRIERTPEGISVHFVNQVDPGATLVPEWILNTVMKRTPERLAALSAYIHFANLERR